MSSRWSPRRTELLVLGALVLASGCDGTDPAPPGVSNDPSIREDASEDAGPAEDEEDASERADSGTRDGGRGAADGGRDASMDAGTRADSAAPDADTGDADSAVDAGQAPDAARVDASSPITLGELWSVERLLVADGERPTVYVVDGNGRQLLERFELVGLGSVHAGPSARFGFVLQPDKDLVHVIDMGLIAGLDPTSRDLVRPPGVLLPPLAGAGPRGFTLQGKERVSVYFEGGAEVLSLRDDARAVEGPTARFPAGVAHAGFVLGVGNEVLTSVGSTGADAVLARLDEQLRPTSTPGWTCSAPSAGAVAGSVAGVICREGVLRYTAGGAPGVLLPYPTSSQPARAERLVPHPSQAAFLTLLDDRVCVVRDAFQCAAPLTAGVVDYTFDRAGKRVLVLTLDGVLHLLDQETLEPYSPVTLLAPSGSPLPEAKRPTLALGRTYLYVSDPQGARVLRVSPNNGALVDSISIPGAVPTKLAVFRYPD